MECNEPVPLSSAEILRLLKDDRGLDRQVRDAIARSLAMDALSGLVSQRLRLDVAERRWPVTIIGPEFER